VSLIVLALAASACDGSDETAERPTLAATSVETITQPTQTTAIQPTTTPVPQPTTPPTVGTALPTGIASVDAAIAAIALGDIDALMQQVAFEKHECVTPDDVEPLEGRPPCPPGGATGDLVEGFKVSQCHGGTITRGNSELIRQAFLNYVSEPLTVYGAYHISPTAWNAGKYAAVFYAPADRPGLSIVAILNDIGVVGIGTGCGNSPAQLAVSGAVQEPLSAR
jgi:hypothetical protein